jgi:hypothetical protein
MSDFFEIDPVSGIKTDWKWSEIDQTYTLERSQDAQASLDWARAQANEGGLNREDIKKGWWQYCTIPPGVQLALMAKGINITDPDHHERMLAEINTNYPHLKTTTGNMGGKTKIYGG